MNPYATPMTREGVTDPSKLSQAGKKLHYANGCPVRQRQGLNRAKKGDYHPRFQRPAHMDGERA